MSMFMLVRQHSSVLGCPVHEQTCIQLKLQHMDKASMSRCRNAWAAAETVQRVWPMCIPARQGARSIVMHTLIQSILFFVPSSLGRLFT